MSGRPMLARSAAVPVNGDGSSGGVHVVDCREALEALLVVPAFGSAGHVLKLSHSLSADPALAETLKSRLLAGKGLPVLALVVPQCCVASLRPMASELAHFGALLAFFAEHDLAAARQHVERHMRAMNRGARISGVTVCYQPGMSVQVRGTIAALVDEGWAPSGLVLPKRSERLSWEAQGQRYSIHRERPPGWSGPRCGWHSVDWWVLRIHLKIDSQEAVARKARLEAQRLAARSTHAGRMAEAAQQRAVAALRSDGAFAGFLAALLPGEAGRTSANLGARCASRARRAVVGKEFGEEQP